MPDNAPTTQESRIHRWLKTAPTRWFVAYAAAAGFVTYFCMYAFRKPFAAAKYEGLMFLGTDVNLKTVLLISQIIGYALSKYAGIKICTEIRRAYLAKFLVGLILFAEFALLLFGVVPEQFKVAAIFLNGIPLGMVWGSVSRYLEGRRASEVMFAGLSCSYIVSSSSVKAFGTWLMDRGIDQFWMPVIAGLFFLPLFVVAVYLLNQLPQPSAADVADRSRRSVMNSGERWAFFRTFLPAMLMLLLVYFAAARGTPKLNPGTSGILFMTEVSVGTISAALLTNEPFGPREILGVGLITAAGLTEAVAPMLMTFFYERGPLWK